MIAEFLLVFLIGILIGATLHWAFHRMKLGSYNLIAKKIINKAELETASLKHSQELALKQCQVEQQRELEQFWQAERRKLAREEERLKLKEDKIESRSTIFDKKLSDVEKREAVLGAREIHLEEDKKRIEAKKTQLIQELERTAGLSIQEAKNMLISQMTGEAKVDAANIIRKIKQETEEEAECTATKIIATAINRLAVSCASESTISTVALPNEDIKGRIIGREGRNIRTLEQLTGINFIIDETPGAVVLSGFDPIRMQVAKMALTDLISDGRIYPTRIEEVVEKAQADLKKQIRQYGEDAALRAGMINLHPELLILLGKLKFRFSYGQNVLNHSLEVSHIMGLIAAELGLDVALAKRIGLLHDMGKAVSHEIEGSHAIIGHDLALKFGESKEVANGIGCHHYEMDPFTVEGSFCSAADAISASRPGARIEAVEEYLKRLKRLEEIACSYPGIEKAYAMQAGREVRIVVLPDIVDDAALTILARDVAKRIEQELSYPGRIRITLIREKRVVHYA